MTEGEDDHIREWRDDFGRVRWQPRIIWRDGEVWHLWRDGWDQHWSAWNGPRDSPVLYRWRWRARRRAQKRIRYYKKIFQPVED